MIIDFSVNTNEGFEYKLTNLKIETVKFVGTRARTR